MSAGAWLDRVGSTQDELHARAAAGAPDGAWLAAREQSGGRGSRGRAWTSPAGGLWLSVLRRATGPASGIELVSLRAGLAVRAALARALPHLPPIQLKWPNDLLVEDRKVGGILVEARWQGDRLLWVAIGLGVNVRNDPPMEVARPAAALAAWCPDANPEALAAPVAAALAGVSLAEPLLTADEVAAFEGCDWLAGRELRGPVRGIGAGIEPDGRLRVRDAAGGVHLIGAGQGLE